MSIERLVAQCESIDAQCLRGAALPSKPACSSDASLRSALALLGTFHESQYCIPNLICVVGVNQDTYVSGYLRKG